MSRDALFRCELCSGTAFTDVFLPDAEGLRRVRSGLVCCVQCRIVYRPPSVAPACNTEASGFRGFGTYGPSQPG